MCLNDFCPNFFTVVVPFYHPTSNVGELLVALLVWQTWLYLIFLILSVQHTCNPLSFIVVLFCIYLMNDVEIFFMCHLYIYSVKCLFKNFAHWKIRLVIFLWLNYMHFPRLFTHQLMDIWVSLTFWLLWVMLMGHLCTSFCVAICLQVPWIYTWVWDFWVIS